MLLIALASLARADLPTSGATAPAGCRGTSSPASRRAARRRPGIWHALTGSIFVILVTAVLAVPIGVAAAIYLEEYGGRSFVARIIEINITNLAAVPSIIYGLLGLGLFVRMLGMGRSVLAGASTLALLVLPVVILSTREALRAVPGVDARRLVRARRHQVADDLVPGAAGRRAGHPDRADPGACRARSAKRRRSSSSAR